MKAHELTELQNGLIREATASINGHYKALARLKEVGFDVDVITDVTPQMSRPDTAYTPRALNLWQTLARRPDQKDGADTTALFRYRYDIAEREVTSARLHVFDTLTPDKVKFVRMAGRAALVVIEHPSQVYDTQTESVATEDSTILLARFTGNGEYDDFDHPAEYNASFAIGRDADPTEAILQAEHDTPNNLLIGRLANSALLGYQQPATA